MPRTPNLFGCLKNKQLIANVCCCGCCIIGRQCNAADGVRNTMSIAHCAGAMLGGYTVCICCLRRKAAEKYGLEENCLISMCISHTCACCSLVQTHKIFRRAGCRPGLMLKPPSLKGMGEEDKHKHRDERRKRRDERRHRNQARRGKRKGNGNKSDSSSESDSSSGSD